MQHNSPFIDEADEPRQVARIVFILIWVTWGTFVFVIFTGLFYRDWALVSVTLAGCLLLGVPFGLVKGGKLRPGSLIYMLIVLITVTLIASVGQGIRDLAITTLPIIFIFAGLTLSRTLFRICVGLTLLAAVWLAVGEVYGWIVTKPFDGPDANWFYLIGVTIILLIGALAVDLLATNMHKNLQLAKQEIAQRKRMEEQLRYQGTHDPLTNIYNRAYFEEELARFERSREFPISIIIADVDGLKRVNDSLGHAAGDQLLRQASSLLSSVVRAGDVLARIGGDEFAALLPATDSNTAGKILARIQERLAEPHTAPSKWALQLSLGAATAEKNNLPAAFNLADQHMYADKSAHKSSAIPRTLD